MCKTINFILLFVIVTGLSACNKGVNSPTNNMNYRQEMRNFVQEISAYSKALNPDFVIIPQNGVELVSTTGDDTGLPEINYISAIDGIGQEDLFYGYNADDQHTPADNNTLYYV